MISFHLLQKYYHDANKKQYIALKYYQVYEQNFQHIMNTMRNQKMYNYMPNHKQIH